MDSETLPTYYELTNFKKIKTFVSKKHSRHFGIMEGHGNFAFNLVVKLSVELGYSFLSLRL
jgi:hypothetical protein